MGDPISAPIYHSLIKIIVDVPKVVIKSPAS
jgi:hypothetical protein